jgi:hypothetical protein
MRTNIFDTRCMIRVEVYKVIIDSGSCGNVVFKEAFKKLDLKTDHHPIL